MATLFPALKNLTFVCLHFVAPLSTTAFSCVLPNATGARSQPAELSAIAWSLADFQLLTSAMSNV